MGRKSKNESAASLAALDTSNINLDDWVSGETALTELVVSEDALNSIIERADAYEQNNAEFEAANEAAEHEVSSMEIDYSATSLGAEPDAMGEPESNYVEEDQRLVTGSNSANAYNRDVAKALSKVGKLGKENGSGKRSLVALAEVVTSESCEGVFVEDDGARIYEKFRNESAKAAGRAAPTEQGDGSRRANESKLRTFIKLGRTRPTDALDTLGTARDMHVAASNSETERKSLKAKGTYDALVSIARAQLKQDTVQLTEDQIRDELFKPEEEKTERTAVDLLKAAAETMDKARKGRKGTDTRPERAPLPSPYIDAAIANIEELLKEYDPKWSLKSSGDKQTPDSENAEQFADAA